MTPRRTSKRPSTLVGAAVAAAGAWVGCSGAAGPIVRPEPFDAAVAATADAGALSLRPLYQVNHEPTLDDVQLVDGRVVCGPAAEVCAVAHDVDGDPLELVLSTPQRCTITAALRHETTTAAGATSALEQCWRLFCHELGEIPLGVVVRDLIDHGGERVAIEDLVGGEGLSSRGELAFAVAFDGTLSWPDRDRDGRGAAEALAEIECGDQVGVGRADNGDDCDDADGTIFLGAREVCRDGEDDDCDGFRDEKCILRRNVDVP